MASPASSEVVKVSSRTHTGQMDGRASAAVAPPLQALVDRLVSKRQIAHAVIGLAPANGSAGVVVASGDARPGEPMRPDTPFFIASITKRFIATLVLRHMSGARSAWTTRS